MDEATACGDVENDIHNCYDGSNEMALVHHIDHEFGREKYVRLRLSRRKIVGIMLATNATRK